MNISAGKTILNKHLKYNLKRLTFEMCLCVLLNKSATSLTTNLDRSELKTNHKKADAFAKTFPKKTEVVSGVKLKENEVYNGKRKIL